METSLQHPIHEVFAQFPGVTGAFTGKGISRENFYFSFQRSGIDTAVLAENLAYYARQTDISPAQITWPGGSWPHSGYAIVAEDHVWLESARTGGIIPITKDSQEPVTYDGIATKSTTYVLGVQGADCPSLFLYDPDNRVIGLAHSGWKPTVRGVVKNTIGAMKRLGASPASMRAFISPGVGDYFNEFQFDEAMETGVREVFVSAGCEDLLEDKSIRHQMSDAEKQRVMKATGRSCKGGISLMLCSLIRRDLMREGLAEELIETSCHSTICEENPEYQGVYMYHSARRDADKDPERPGFGSNLCILQLRE